MKAGRLWRWEKQRWDWRQHSVTTTRLRQPENKIIQLGIEIEMRQTLLHSSFITSLALHWLQRQTFNSGKFNPSLLSTNFTPSFGSSGRRNELDPLVRWNEIGKVWQAAPDLNFTEFSYNVNPTIRQDSICRLTNHNAKAAADWTLEIQTA